MRHQVLFIDRNNPALRQRLVSTLAREGFEVATVASVEQALSALGEPKPDLIIIGEGLMDAFKTCSELRRMVDVPIMMLDAGQGKTVWAKAVESGADFYLVKPFSHLELTARVKALLRRYLQTQTKREKEVGNNARL